MAWRLQLLLATNTARELRTPERADKILEWVSGEMLDELITNAMFVCFAADLEGLSLGSARCDGAPDCAWLTSDAPENKKKKKPRSPVDRGGLPFRTWHATAWPTGCLPVANSGSSGSPSGQSAKPADFREPTCGPKICLPEIERSYPPSDIRPGT